MTNIPSTENEWTIHSINIHGLFFERWCQEAIESVENWKVKSTQYPVDFTTQNGKIRGNESALDIRAELNHKDLRITLLIECKKNNPDFINWIFFPTTEYLEKKHSSIMLQLLEHDSPNSSLNSSNEYWSLSHAVSNFSLEIPISDEAREVRSSYAQYQKNDKTKTSNAAISEAAYQVALATQAVFIDEYNFERKFELGVGCICCAKTLKRPPDWITQSFIPVIVTTARLYICEFNVNDINPLTGEIAFDKPTLKEYPYLLYDYTLPRHLQRVTNEENKPSHIDTSGRWMKRTIMVVHSGEFINFLTSIAKNPYQFVGERQQ